ncbi:MAG: hypothetical protein A2087_11795 [Spirochaetes bacterium GWD1_61_31]|nr:MAG: hypothetical protein A2Y37_04670 [Spirochaetes bacterium GWB1_60_80]OHD34779.1 MAG: hypothetical protein A2004_08665 [Spirochaetes bacterium GWC1_61_12]OHD41717.1 MAG: hypothetical protein A2087_11795 [Spirochaetes bacterium GWD1_61_31]OHD44617.1 MAG: hypothetical protein A2Y35_12020 [Spirochaetes bacterium GWE1_60_18]OHD57941.1 MAG: hypothetical protein A2Y32_04015 [Spirochaetes bacterium GWF1_60_12]HAP43932.1 hypothetical protein [Spirochaetaceae bacterium]
MRIRKISWLVLLGLLSAVMLAAQSANQQLMLDFVDGSNFSFVTPDGITYNYPNGVVEGDSIPVGAVVTTGTGTSVELRLQPNGTLLKLAADTSLRIEAIASASSNVNTFSLIAGKIRAVAARGSNYNIQTSSTVCGVRGTDFTMAFQEGTRALLLVSQGAVEFGRRTASGIADAVTVNQGQFSEFFSSFAPSAYSPEMFAQEYGDVDIPAERLPPQTEETAAVTEEPADNGQPVNAGAVNVGSGDSDTGTESDDSAAPAVDNAIIAWLQDILGMEIGAITINGNVWSKAVLQPRFQLGDLRVGLYLPIIYQNDLFDINDWYRPAGNNEWSFGFDIGWTSNTLAALFDAVSDLALKIRYLEYGDQLGDPFFFKVGNVDSFTIGHGLIMRDYANDADFPAVRHLGFNLGLDLNAWGFEVLTNDLTAIEILGSRVYMRPVPSSKVAFGLSAVADLHPAAGFNTELAPDGAAAYGDPVLLGLGLDVDVPFLNNDILGLRFFAETAAMAPIVRNDFTYDGNAGAKGFRFDMIFNGTTVTNWGVASGIIGNVLFIDWRLEYRYFTGAFQPAFFDAGYERRRMEIVERYAAYLSDPDLIDQSPNVMGVYGEGGASLFNDKLNLTLGYFWPFDIAQAVAAPLGYLAASNDYFIASLEIVEGLIPILDISGSISYERRNFIPTILQQNGEALTLFDGNTTFSGELVVPVPNAPFLRLAVMFSTTIARDDAGEIVLDVNGNPQMWPLITLETRLSF